MRLSVVDRNSLLSNELHELLERRLSFALSRFDSRIMRVTATFEDVNGPRGGTDKLCRITVKLVRSPDVVVSDQDSDLGKCIAHASDRAGRAVARSIDRSQQIRRLTPQDSGSA